jgi:hypothetical protein
MTLLASASEDSPMRIACSAQNDAISTATWRKGFANKARERAAAFSSH